MKQVKYEYKNCPIPGGGYVTGFLFHPTKKDILYCRTDIGGTYRYEKEDNSWSSLNEDVGMQDLSLTYPIALCCDEKKEDVLYIVSGCINWKDIWNSSKGTFSVSLDGGKSFYNKKMPCVVHGNLPGRGSGKRLIMIRRENASVFYYASQLEGLFCSTDEGETWKSIDVFGEKCMTFVWANETGETLIVGTAGNENSKSKMRGHSLFISYDSGNHFDKLVMPENEEMKESKYSGFVPHRYDYDGKYFYCTLNYTGPSCFVKELAYSCDTGKVINGRVLRYSFEEDGRVAGYEDITPDMEYEKERYYEVQKDSKYMHGFGGISTCKSMPGLLTTATICRDWGDIIYISHDYGNTWEVALSGLEVGNIHFNSSYMKPEYNGGYSLIHWLTDITINPYNKDEVWFNTGTGVFRGINFTSKDRSFSDCSKGIEETVHLQVHSPVAGPVLVLDVVGDLGGFAFKDLDVACENSFADAEGNRYITCQNLDYADKNPNYVIATARGNWKGVTKGGLILSKDYGQHFERIPLPYGISNYLDEQCKCIERPNRNAGWVTISADVKYAVFCVCERGQLPMKGIVRLDIANKKYEKVKVFDQFRKDISNSDITMKVFADRMNEKIFYGFGDDLLLYRSEDKGKTFYQIPEPEIEMDGVKRFGEDKITLQIGCIENNTKTEIRPENFKSGIFYAALNQYGLVKIDLRRGCNINRITEDEDIVFCVGLGRRSNDKEYHEDEKAIYICGVLDGEYGFFRSFDGGNTWEKINDKKQQFGDIRSIDGDSRKVGRFFIATGSFGLKYGDVC